MTQHGTFAMKLERHLGSIVKHSVIAGEPRKTRAECLARPSHVLDGAKIPWPNRLRGVESEVLVSRDPLSDFPQPDHDGMWQARFRLIDEGGIYAFGLQNGCGVMPMGSKIAEQRPDGSNGVGNPP